MSVLSSKNYNYYYFLLSTFLSSFRMDFKMDPGYCVEQVIERTPILPLGSIK